MDNEYQSTIAKEVARRVRLVRRAAGMSMSELARQMQAKGWTKYAATYSMRLEKEDREPRVSELYAIAECLGVNVSELLPSSKASASTKEPSSQSALTVSVKIEGIPIHEALNRRSQDFLAKLSGEARINTTTNDSTTERKAMAG